jgi:hypothetical protein
MTDFALHTYGDLPRLGGDPDATAEQLRTWGLSAEALRNAPVAAQPFISMLRAVNLGQLDPSILGPLFADSGIDPAAVALAHPPFALDGDGDLGLPGSAVLWDFGDGTATEYGAAGVTHVYPPGDDIYLARCVVTVCGINFQSVEYVTVGVGIVAPALTAIEPESAPAGPPSNFTLHVYGANFTRDSRIVFAGVTEPSTQYGSPNALTLEISAGLFPGADPAIDVHVTTPPPGGGTSAALTFAFVEGTP